MKTFVVVAILSVVCLAGITNATRSRNQQVKIGKKEVRDILDGAPAIKEVLQGSCIDISIDSLDFHHTVCVNEKAEFTVDGKTELKWREDSTNLCFGLPVELLDLCVDISLENGEVCVGLSLEILDITLVEIDLGCFIIGESEKQFALENEALAKETAHNALVRLMSTSQGRRLLGNVLTLSHRRRD